MNLTILLIVKLLINCIYTEETQNATYGNFSQAVETCKKSGGFAPRDIINSLPFGHHQFENCAVAKSLELEDGESLWTHYRAEFGAYIAPFGCAKTLPNAFKESLNSTNMLFRCTKLCSRKQPKIKYIGIQNGDCYCMADRGSFTITKCQNESNLNNATVAFVYELININVQREAYACITGLILLNNSWIYDAAKCSEKHQGVCTSDGMQGFEAVQRKCLYYKDTFASIGRNVCILNRTMFKDDIYQTCMAYSMKMPPIIYQGIDRYSAFSGSFYLSSMRTFRIIDNDLFTFDNSSLTCVSLYKRGCAIILQPDRCRNVNRFRCQFSSISRERTGFNKNKDSVVLIAILVASALLLTLVIFFLVRFKYMNRTRKSADICMQNVNPEILEQELVSTSIYHYATTFAVNDRPARGQNIYSVSEDIILNGPSNTYHPHEKRNMVCSTENTEYDVTTTSGRGTLQPNMTKVYTYNNVQLGINAGEYDHIRPPAKHTVTRK